MRTKNTCIFGSAMIALLIGLAAVTAAPAWAGEREERVKAIEEELAVLKERQREMKQDALAAKAKMPDFRYRPGRGLNIRAADRSWGMRFSTRMQLYSTFWLDENRPSGSTSQGVIHVRRARPRFHYYWADGFHEFDFQVNVDNGGSSGGGLWSVQHAEYAAHFEKINPWLPTLALGPRPSARLNPQDTNCSSARCGRSERSMLNEGVGITTGTVERGFVLSWRRLPVGPARISFFNVGFGIEGVDEFNSGSGTGLKNDSKALYVGLGVEPFRKIKNKWVKGLEVSFGGIFHNIATDGFGGYNIRTNQTRFQRIRLIRTDDRDGGRQYMTVGLGWKLGPYRLRLARTFDNSHRETGLRGDDGSSIKGRGFRILHEIWLWSPKGGFLTGSPSKRSFMLAPMFQRVDVRAPNAMSSCSSATGGCQGAYATNAGLALWYFTGIQNLNFGVVWDYWSVNKANSDVATRIEKGKTGRSVSFNTLTLVFRSDW